MFHDAHRNHNENLPADEVKDETSNTQTNFEGNKRVNEWSFEKIEKKPTGKIFKTIGKRKTKKNNNFATIDLLASNFFPKTNVLLDSVAKKKHKAEVFPSWKVKHWPYAFISRHKRERLRLAAIKKSRRFPPSLSKEQYMDLTN